MDIMYRIFFYYVVTSMIFSLPLLSEGDKSGQ